jgi:hypothetical protein
LCAEARLIHYGGRAEKVRGEKMIRLFRAKHQLCAKHWRPGAVRWGARLLVAWAGSRYAIHSLLGLVKPRYRATAQEWRTVFERRGEYTHLPPPGNLQKRTEVTAPS